MNDVDLILRVIARRSFDQSSCAYTIEGEEDWPEERALSVARFKVLDALAAEIRASLRPAGPHHDVVRPAEPKTMWFLLTEMGGSMRAVIFDTVAEAEKAKDAFHSTYKLVDDYECYAACDIQQVSVAPRRGALNGRLDGRFACLIQAGGAINVSIHETEDELKEALEEAREWYGEDRTATYRRCRPGIPGCNRR